LFGNGSYGRAIAVDSVGNTYLAGETYSDDFPGGPPNTDPAVSSRAFLTTFTAATGPLAVRVTDAAGNAVSALATNDAGWPIINATTQDIAGPLQVIVTLTNNTSDPRRPFRLNLTFNSPNSDPTPTRFYIVSSPPFECVPQQIDYHNLDPSSGSKFSYVGYETLCNISVGANQSRDLVWEVWMQPSTAGSLRIFALEDSYPDNTSEAEASIQAPEARIRPVVIVPGIVGTFVKDGQHMLDPITGVYKGIIDQLEYLGYERDLTIVPFAYQWYGNLANATDVNNVPDLAAELDTLIDNWWTNRLRPSYVDSYEFDLITHSTGGLVVRDYVSVRNDAGRVHTAILVAAPHQGAPKAYSAWEGLEPRFGWIPDKLLRRFLRGLAKKAGCYNEYTQSRGNTVASKRVLVSDEHLYQYVHGLDCRIEYYYDGQLTKTDPPRAQAGLPLLRDLLPSSDAQDLHPYLDDGAKTRTGPINTTLDSLNQPSLANTFVQRVTDNGHLFNVYSNNLETYKGYLVTTDPSVAPLWMNGDAKPIDGKEGSGYLKSDPEKPEDEERAGDETVPAWSADLRQIVGQGLQDDVVSIIIKPGVAHSKFFNSKEALRQFIVRLVDPAPSQAFTKKLPISPQVGQDLPSGTGILFTNECPVTMLITDPLGRRIGTTPDGQDVNEIPDAVYTGQSVGIDPELILIPEPPTGVYTVTVKGLEADVFTVSGEVISDTTASRLGYFSGDIQPGQVFTYTTAPYRPEQAPSVLLVDDHAGAQVTAIYSTTLADLGRSATVWEVPQQGAPGFSDLYPYDTVVWATGNSAAFTETHAVTLQSYVTYGGAALLSGQDVDSGFSDPAVLSATLRAEVLNPTVDGRTLEGNDLLNGLLLDLNGGDSAANQTTPSALAPLPDAVPLAQYRTGTGSGQTAGLRYETVAGRLIYLGFGFEGIRSADQRSVVLDRLLRWLETGEEPAAYALAFDGADDEVRGPPIPAGGGPLTIEAWVRPDTDTQTAVLMLSTDDTAGWSLELDTGQLVWWAADSNGQFSAARNQNITLRGGYWYHVAVSYEAGMAQVFVNGDPGPAAAVGPRSQGPWFRLGGNAGYPFFAGQIDEVRLSNVVRYAAAFT
ncbi:MAG: LamG domain-containing protein, partial [Chloroflexales bacterium]|nr:LamG domain-containing protein [Chloroflexales bacterium]